MCWMKITFILIWWNVRNILIDADGCPVTQQVIHLASLFGVNVIIVCDTSHDIYYEGITTILADKGKDSSDFVLLQNIQPQDILITQDYGLAALALSKGAYPLSQDGMRYTDENIDGLLFQRMMGAKQRKQGYRHHIAKRTAMQDKAFEDALYQILLEGDSDDKTII